MKRILLSILATACIPIGVFAFDQPSVFYVSGTKAVIGESGVTEICQSDESTCSTLGAAGVGDLLADGTIPLTADWDAGNSLYDITAVEFKGALAGNATTATDTAAKTGTGSTYATSTSPTFVTPALGTPASGTLTNCSFPTLNQNTTGSAASCTGNSATVTGFTPASGSLTLAGADALTITTTAGTSVTLPTSGTLVNSAVATLSSLTSVGTIGTGTWASTDVGIAYGGTGASTASAAFTALKQAATSSATGVSELAIASEVNTGNDTARAITPDALAGSNLGEKSGCLAAVESDTDTAVANGKEGIVIPASLNGMNIVEVVATVHTAGTTGTTDIQVRRRRAGADADVLSTKMTIDTGETSTITAATPAVVNAANDDLNTGDVIYFDIDSISTTAAKGLSVCFTARLP